MLSICKELYHLQHIQTLTIVKCTVQKKTYDNEVQKVNIHLTHYLSIPFYYNYIVFHILQEDILRIQFIIEIYRLKHF